MQRMSSLPDHFTRCALCNKPYGQTRAALVDDTPARSVFHITCAECNVATLVFVSAGQFGIVSFGILTDLHRQEARRALSSDAITTDHVLTVHTFLKTFTGGMQELVASHSPK